MRLKKALPGAVLVVFCLFTLPAHAIFIYTIPAAGWSSAKPSWHDAERKAAADVRPAESLPALATVADVFSAPSFERSQARSDRNFFFWAYSVRSRFGNWNAADTETGDKVVGAQQTSLVPTSNGPGATLAVNAPVAIDAPILELPSPSAVETVVVDSAATLAPAGGLVQDVIEAGAKLPDVELVSSSITSVPEPGTTGLFLAGLAILLAGSWCRRARPLELGRRSAKLRRHG